MKDSILSLLDHNIRNIELSGGLEYSPRYKQDLLNLKNKYNINFLLHNYFPPPKVDFVMNLASQNKKIFSRTCQHIEKAVSLSKYVGAGCYGFHAGFLMNPKAYQLGEAFSISDLTDKETAIQIFCKGYNYLKQKIGNFKLYIENNVISYENFKTFGKNPFLLTSSKDYFMLKQLIDFNLLLDIGHLKVSSHTLNLNFYEELEILINCSDYIHLSDNDGYQDLNFNFNKESSLFNHLKKLNLSNKIITLEMNDEITALKDTCTLIKNIL